MASVVFFRAVNVGGHQKFQPSRLAEELAGFGVTNIGAAGTFVVSANVSAPKLRSEMLRRLPFAPEMMICSAREVLAMAKADPFREAPAGKDVKRFVTVLQRTPAKPPKLPLAFPGPGRWEIQFLKLAGHFLLSVRRPGAKDLYPNAVAEKFLGLPATTRNWNTLETILRVLAS